MISNVTNTTAADAATPSASGQSNVSTVNTPFGELFVSNIDSNPQVVGYNYGPQSQAASSGASSNTSASLSASLVAATPVTVPGVSTTDPNAVPTAESVFGDAPWVSNAGGTGPTGDFNLNPMYFATQQTAAKVAAMVGGSVVEVDTFAQTPGNHFKQNVPNEMIKLADGKMINAGLVAGFFTHGYQLSMVQDMIQNEVRNVESEQKGVTTT